MISAIPDKSADQDTTLNIDFTVDDGDSGQVV
jgi:hypothetical protein